MRPGHTRPPDDTRDGRPCRPFSFPSRETIAESTDGQTAGSAVGEGGDRSDLADQTCGSVRELFGVLDGEELLVEAGEVKVALPATHAPNVYVSLIAPAPRTRFPIYSTEADIHKPVALFGMARIDIKPPTDTLSVAIASAPRDRTPGSVQVAS